MKASDPRPGTPAAARRRAGVVLPTVLVILLTVCTVVGLLARYSVRSMRLARRTLDVRRAFVAAEAGIGYGVMRTRALLLDGGVSGFYANYASIEAPPTPDPDYELRLLVRPISASSSHGATVSEEGSIEVVAGARNLESGVSCALRVTISAIGERLSDYAVFFDGDLEANVGSSADTSLTFRGKIHTNSDLYVSRWVKFMRNVTCNGSFYHGRKSQRGRKNFRDTGVGNHVEFVYGNDDAVSGSEKDASDRIVNTWDGTGFVDEDIGTDWIAKSSLYYGEAVQTGQNGVPKLTPPISVDDDQHTLIEPALDSEDPGYRAETEAQKFSKKAALTLHVYPDGTYTLRDNVHETFIVERSSTAADLESKEAEPYQPGYWKGTCGDQTKYVPGFWGDATRPNEGTFNDKPDSGGGSWTWEWVPEYTPPVTDNARWWLSNHPGIGTAQGWGGPADRWISSVYAGKWTHSQTNVWDTSLNSGSGGGSPGTSAGKFNPGYARHVVYAKDQRTSGYILKKRGYGIQTVRTDPSDSAGVQKKGNMFIDQRQHFIMAPTDIYLDAFLGNDGVKAALRDAPGGETGIGKILYVELDRPEIVRGERFKVWKDADGVWQQERTPSGGEEYTLGGSLYPEPCVRIRNGSDPGTDLSIVTDKPVYIEGDFNTKVVGYDSDGSEVYRNMLVAGDRITQLSKNWQDAWEMPCPGNSTLRNAYWNTSGGQGTIRPDSWTLKLDDSRRKAVTTTINSVLMMGIYPSTKANNDNVETGYSGGLENIIRFVENWDKQTSFFNGSIICLWNTRADDVWKSPGVGNKVYVAPRRSWAYAHMSPPGMPGFFAVREATWERVAWSSVDWDGSSGGGGDGD